MKLINSLFAAIVVTIMITIAGSGITQVFNEAQNKDNDFITLGAVLNNTAYAQESTAGEDTISENDNYSSTTSLNILDPSSVIDIPTLPSSQENSSQSSQQEDPVRVTHKDILSGLVPISGEHIDYETVLGISSDEITFNILKRGMSIWEIALAQEETELLETAYCAAYSAEIIQLLTEGEITRETADALIAQAMDDIANHQNISIEKMIENMIPND